MDANKTGAYLAMLRKTKGLTQEAAAEILGVSNKTVSKWETGGGLPEITVLPALAELYGVTADDILAGQTLHRECPPETAALKQRLMSRLRLRFDVCLAVALALAVTARLGIPYVSLAALPLSVAMGWIGFVLAAHPVRYGGVEAEGAFWLNLLRKLLLASTLQWYAFVCLLRLGTPDWESVDLTNPTLSYTYDDWKPLIFCVGLLALIAAFALAARRLAGPEKGLLGLRLSRGQKVLLFAAGVWLVVFWALWAWVDGRYVAAIAPWIQRYGENVMQDSRFDEWWPKLKAQRDAEVLPWLRARRAVLAAGGVTGLGLLIGSFWTLRLRRKRMSPSREPSAGRDGGPEV